MKITIDRIEKNFAVVEVSASKLERLPIGLLPKGAKEGDVLSIEIDNKETGKREKVIGNLLNELWEK